MAFIPLTDAEREAMLATIGVATIDDLFADVPPLVRFPELDLPAPLSEMEVARQLRDLAGENRHVDELSCFVGAGCYNHYVPAAVGAMAQRAEFLTAYTPYQPEMAQGTLQYMFEFQSMVCDLLGMDVANSSVYDGSTAAAEAVLMAQRITRRDRVILAGDLHPEYRATIRTYLSSREVDVVDSAVRVMDDQVVAQSVADLLDDSTACVVVQQPTFFGRIADLSGLADRVHAAGALLIVAVPESTSLGLLKPPGAWGADIAVAEGQPLGVAMSYGGPWAGLMATRTEYVRQLPGRIVGQTVDHEGRRGFVLTLQAREQHIRREKATSNICTSETLLALCVTVYLSLLGPKGLRSVASLSHDRATALAERVGKLDGFQVLTPTPFYNEFVLRGPRPAAELRQDLLRHGILGGVDLGRHYPALGDGLLLCCTELNTPAQIDALVAALAEIGGGR